MGLAPPKEAGDVGTVICDLLRDFKAHVKTLTYDNGKEFAYHHLINQILEISILLCSSISLMGTRAQRKHQWTNPAVFP